MLTEPLTGARYPAQSDGPLGGLQIGYAVTDLADNTIPRYATSGARDAAYNTWTAAGNTMTAGMFCTVAGRLQRYNGTGWETVPGHRGAGTAFPADAVPGDTYDHATFRCYMRYNGGGWLQETTTRVATDADRASYLAALTAAGLTLDNGHRVFQDDTNTVWASPGGNTLLQVGGYGDRSTAQVSRVGLAVPSNNNIDSWTKVSGWSTVKSTPDVTIASSGTLTCNRYGWVAINGYAWSDDTVAGRAGVAVDIPAASFPVSRIIDQRARAVSTAYSSAGALRQMFSWSGRVVAGDAFSIYVNQDSADAGSVDFNVHASVEYLT